MSNQLMFMSLLILLGLHSIQSRPQTDPSGCNAEQWRLFKESYNKTYLNQQEDKERFGIFCNTWQRNIKNWNVSGNSVPVNGLADLKEDEFIMLDGIQAPQSGFNLSRTPAHVLGRKMMELGYDDFWGELPQSVDWSLDPTRVSHVRDQGKCGVCWAFATVGLLEGQQKLGQPVIPLSEQHLIDCRSVGDPCDGSLDVPLQIIDIINQGGVLRQDDLHYQAPDNMMNRKCKRNPLNSFPTTRNIGDHHILPQGDVQFMKRMLAKYGPILVSIVVKDPRNYQGVAPDHVYYSNTTGMHPNHEVLLVGYGVNEHGEEYWKIKNSWSTRWGKQGYGFISRDPNHDMGIGNEVMIILPS